MVKIKQSDLLVIEDKDGRIYRDFVEEIEDNIVLIAHTEDEEDEYFHTVICNQFEIHLDSDYNIIKINYVDCDEIHYNCFQLKYRLKQIWTKVDEDTYKKVWEIDPIDDAFNKVKDKFFKELKKEESTEE